MQYHIRVRMMKKLLFVLVLSAAFAAAGCAPTEEVREPHADLIVADILKARDALAAGKRVPPLFVTFWDFDGTIIQGDCSLGHDENGTRVYPGLAEVAISKGLSPYFGKKEYPRFLRNYLAMERRGRHSAASTYIPRVFRGASLDEIRDLAGDHFTVMSAHYFTSSMRVIVVRNSFGK